MSSITGITNIAGANIGNSNNISVSTAQITSLTPGTYIGTDANDNIISFPTPGGGSITSVTGTPNEVIAVTVGGAVTLSTPQPIAYTSTPTFLNLILTGLASGQLLVTTGSALTGAGYDSTGNVGSVIIQRSGNDIKNLQGNIILGQNSSILWGSGTSTSDLYALPQSQYTNFLLPPSTSASTQLMITAGGNQNISSTFSFGGTISFNSLLQLFGTMNLESGSSIVGDYNTVNGNIFTTNGKISGNTLTTTSVTSAPYLATDSSGKIIASTTTTPQFNRIILGATTNQIIMGLTNNLTLNALTSTVATIMNFPRNASVTNDTVVTTGCGGALTAPLTSSSSISATTLITTSVPSAPYLTTNSSGQLTASTTSNPQFNYAILGASTNQLIMGVTNNVTLNAPTSTNSVIFNIPRDPSVTNDTAMSINVASNPTAPITSSSTISATTLASTSTISSSHLSTDGSGNVITGTQSFCYGYGVNTPAILTSTLTDLSWQGNILLNSGDWGISIIFPHGSTIAYGGTGGTYTVVFSGSFYSDIADNGCFLAANIGGNIDSSGAIPVSLQPSPVLTPVTIQTMYQFTGGEQIGLAGAVSVPLNKITIQNMTVTITQSV